MQEKEGVFMGQKALQRTKNHDWELQVIPGTYYIDFDREDKCRRSGGRQRKSSARRRKRRKSRRIGKILAGAAAVYLLAVSLPAAGRALFQGRTESERFLNRLESDQAGEAYPEELLEMLEKNEETYDFVTDYPNRADYMGKEINLTADDMAGQVPLLMQWDKRWGYDRYGQEMIAVAGCGPTCMAMAYLHLTGDTSMNPRKMAEYACESGFCTEAGTSWEFFTAGAAGLGLSGRELPLGETQIKNALDQGNAVILSMRPGDFTTTGHFILLRGYDEKGFYVNDPNSRKNSEKQWTYDRISGQIKCLWSIGIER